MFKLLAYKYKAATC